MGWTDDPIGEIAGAVKGALGISSGGSPTNIQTMTNEPYKARVQNWYRALPYGFRFNSRDGKSWTCYLPLAPENIAVSTHFGTNIIPTLYGTLEEHSDQRYYDIVISGTTGFMPRYYTPFKGSTERSLGRTSYKDDKSGVGIDPQLAGGFFQSSIGALNQGLNTLNKMAENFSGVEISSGVDPAKSGYMAFHNFYRFLLAYKKDAAGLTTTKKRSKHPLTFLNYKDSQQYDCAITKFDLKRSAASPHLYNYTIAMRAYNLRDVNDLEDAGSSDEILENLGLTGVKGSLFQKMKQTSNGAKGLIGVASGGFGG